MRGLKTIVLVWCWMFGVSAFGNSDSIHSKTIIKTNVLNSIMIPSLHLEQQISPKGSLQLNVHRGKIVFISLNEWVNISLNCRRYLKLNLTGIYGAAGLNYYNDLNGSRRNSQRSRFLTGNMSLGPELRLGYQKPIKNSRWHFDTNIGFAFPFIPLHPYFGEEVQARLFLGIGYQLK